VTELPQDSAAAAEGQPPAPGPPEDRSKAQVLYMNFCRVTGTPEEVILDFALQTEPGGGPDHALAAPQRITLSHYTAMRLVHALRLTVERHEAVFGPVETTIEKRFVRPLL
jgi:hypothetical protein